MTTALMFGVALEIWGVIICLVCIFVAAGQFHIFEKRNKYLMILLAINSITLAVDAYGRLYDAGVIGPLPSLWVKFCYFTVFETGYLLPAVFLLYVGALIQERKAVFRKEYLVAGVVVSLIGTFFLVLTQFNDFYYYFDDNMKYHRNPAFAVSMWIGIIGILLVAVMIFQYRKAFRKNDRKALRMYIFFPLLALTIQIGYKGISLLNIATTASLLFIFIAHEIELTKMLQEKQELLLQKEIEETERRYELLQSQIEPHFLFNSLSSICAMCEDQNAVEVLQNFARYLRMNMDAIHRDDNIPFSQEIEHVQAYLSIELLRFEERLNVVFHIEETDFSIPPLALETLVENAVKHGISMKRAGGTVRISSKAILQNEEKCYEVVVEDDGVGFDLNKISADGKGHIGLSNVKQRLESRCNGSLVVESEIGRGTKATMLLREMQADKKSNEEVDL